MEILQANFRPIECKTPRQKDELEDIHQVYLEGWRIGTHPLSGQLLNKSIYQKMLEGSLRDLE